MGFIEIEKKCTANPIKAFLFIGFMVYVMLFTVIHSRGDQDYSKYTSVRTMNLINFWKDNGYFSHGGLWAAKNGDGTFYDLSNVKNKTAETIIYTSYPMAHLIPGNVLERLYMKITGLSYSWSLMRYINQMFVLISSVLLATIVFRLGIRFGAKIRTSFISAISCLIVFQTFPNNLFYIWEIQQPGVSIIFILLFLINFEKISQDKAQSINLIVGAFAIFFASYIDLFNTTLFVFFLLFSWYIFGSKNSLYKYWIRVIILPVLLAILLFACQLFMAYINNPNAGFAGSGFYFRSGLDGSTEYYRSHLALITRRDPMPYGSFLLWPFLAFGGLATFMGLLISYNKLIKDEWFALLTFSLLGLYFPTAFVLSQVVSIHPYYYDPYLAVTAIFLLFGVAPLLLEKMANEWGGYCCLFGLVAACYVFVQLRSFMIAYPRIS